MLGARTWVNVSSLAFPSVLRSRLDRCSKWREEKGLQASDEQFLCRGQVADCWSWEMKAGEDH